MADADYKRLTRSQVRSRFAVATTSRSSLWLGPDHLLVIDTNGYTETYKRFYFRDIQAITITLSQRRLTWNWVLGVLTGVTLGCWLIYFLSSRNLDWLPVVIALGMIALFAIPLLLNNTLGPTCTCQLRTAVQTEELCPLGRLERARRVIGELRPLILQAQGGAGFADIPPPTARSEGAPAVSSAGASGSLGSGEPGASPGPAGL